MDFKIGDLVQIKSTMYSVHQNRDVTLISCCGFNLKTEKHDTLYPKMIGLIIEIDSRSITHNCKVLLNQTLYRISEDFLDLIKKI